MTLHWTSTLLFAFGIGATVAAGPSADWPQWRGPNRNGLSSETGLLAKWPASGPPQTWTTNGLGGGYGSVAVAGDRIFVQGARGRQSVINVLSRDTGKGVWSKALGAAGSNDRGSGPRSTPTVDGDRVYVLTEEGDLWCLKAANGTEVWTRNILREFGGRQIPWLISESPLVDGNNVIVTPGGPRAGMAALDKMTGKTVWTTQQLSDEAGYASPIVGDVRGPGAAGSENVRVYMTLTSQSGVGVRASDGKLLWRFRPVANDTANIATPIFHDNKVFYSSAYGTGAALLALTPGSGEVTAQQVYFTREMQNHHGGLVLVDGYLYGFHNSILVCLEFGTGRVVWRNRSVGKGTLTFADGNLYILSEDNVVGLVAASAAGYQEHGRFSIPDAGLPSWAHLVVSGGQLYVRNQDTLTAFDVRSR